MKALILTANGVEDLELFYPYYRFKEEGLEVDVATPDGGNVVGEHGYSLEADRSFADVHADDYDLLFLPGGKGPEKVRLQSKAVDITRRMFEADKMIAAICHGPWMLASADIIKGVKLTSFYSIKDDLVHAGAEWVDEKSVHDGRANIITSRDPRDLPAFCTEIIEVVSRQAAVGEAAR